MMTPELQIFPDSAHLSKSAARFFCDAADEALDRHGFFSCVLSGGSTPVGMYQNLVGEPCQEKVDWNRVHLFWGDERCVPPDHLESNFYTANQHLIKQIRFPGENIHRIKGELSPARAVEDYNQQLMKFASRESGGLPYPIFDLVILGLGQDGHIASIFPGSEDSLEPVIHVTAHYEGRPAERVTLTPVVFNQARKILILVAGENKQRALFQSLYGHPDSKNWPVQRLQLQTGRVVWMVDQAAAGGLPDTLPIQH